MTNARRLAAARGEKQHVASLATYGDGLVPPDEHEGAVVAAAYGALHGGDELRRARVEAGDDHPLRLAEQPVDALVDVPARRLHHAVGVQHDRVAAAEHPLVGDV